MKRLIEFKYSDNKYILEEDGEIIFAIKVSDLKFNSLDFYNGLYKEKSPNIELVDKLESDSHKKGKYIFTWLSNIISDIKKEFSDQILEGEIEGDTVTNKKIPFYEFAACAGDGFFIDNNVPHTDILTDVEDADFAVKISGDSMEPTIKNGSIVYVRQAEVLQHNDIGLFIVNGDVMCKRYIIQGRGFKLVPDNDKYKPFSRKDIETYKVLGKVLAFEET